jgi:hypothetical protein
MWITLLKSQQPLSHSSLKSAYNVSRRGESNNKKTAEGAKNTDDTDWTDFHGFIVVSVRIRVIRAIRVLSQ